MPRTSKRSKSEAPVDMHAVAKHANVSIATVSRTINRNPTVNPKMAKRVWNTIHELGYMPNSQARALVSGRSGILGLIVSDISNPFFPELIQGFEDVAVENGYEILVSSTNYSPTRMESCIRRMLQRKAEGVAIMTFGIEQPILKKLYDRNVPVVFVDVGPNVANVKTVKVDYHAGIRQGVQHLAALGHRNIGFVSGPADLRSAQMRVAAFKQSLAECGIGLNEEWLVSGEHTLNGGSLAMEQILATGNRPTAVMCSNDVSAIGVLHKAYRAGLRVPQDVSVIGFDDILAARMMIPPLTSIEMSRVELARAAVMALHSLVEGTSDNREHTISTRLVVRESTGYPPGTMSDLLLLQKNV
jgi:DNA-binding LacI/PurR family transcriptional regulator